MRIFGAIGVIVMLAMRPICWPLWAVLLIVFAGMAVASEKK